MRRFTCFMLFFAACTADNPLYSPSSGMDFAISVTPTDLAGTNPGADLSSPKMGCMDGQRACTMSKAESVVCTSGIFVGDRTCPMGSTCADGHCGLPAAGANNSGRSCTGLAGGANASICFQGAVMPFPDCEPFVQMGAIVWECAPPVGDGVVGTMCTTGMTCRSGFCGSNGTCFRACTLPTDCPTSGGNWVCSPVKITVEGLKTTANSCIPG